jgi:hypothetical protein
MCIKGEEFYVPFINNKDPQFIDIEYFRILAVEPADLEIQLAIS